MNRQRGFSTISMVMMLMVLGGVMPHGLEQHLRAQSSLIFTERDAIQAFNNALSAQAWGTTVNWQPGSQWKCQMKQNQGWRTCIKAVGKDDVLLAAQGNPDNQPITLWRWGKQGTRNSFSSNGWIDICPLSEAASCLLP